MKLINLCCGGIRSDPPWINVEYDGVTHGNYVQLDITSDNWPWENESIDGILCSHVFEHFTVPALQKILRECYRILKVGGVLRIAVPNATYFRSVYDIDNKESVGELFGEVERINGPQRSFMGFALFYDEHLQLFTEDTLWCTLVNNESPVGSVSFLPENVKRTDYKKTSRLGHYCSGELAALDNRPKFSLFMEAFK